MVIQLFSFRYIDVDGETIETPFQALEVVSIIVVQLLEEQPKSEPSMAFYKGVGNVEG